MRFSFWRSRNRFSLDELRYLTDQLQKIQVVNEVNKDFVIEALRSIAELITYGDQHDSNFFDFFMEKQVMGEFVRILKVSRIVAVPLQLLQTMSIMIQNLKTEHAIYYMFSNEHINFLITYSFDFRNEELLSYYISFLRAISGKLDQSTISLLVKTQNEEVVSFPLYVEAIRFAFHEENMVRTAVRALTLNVYHVGDEAVNKFVTKAPHCDYFPHLVAFFCKQCVDLNGLVSETLGSRGTDATKVFSAIDDIEDNLYYFSDVISAGIPDVGRLITDSILQLLILPIILPSFWTHALNEIQISAVTSLFLLCCILRIVKIRDLANIVVAAFFCSPKVFMPNSEAKLNGYNSNHDVVKESKESGNDNLTDFTRELRVTIPNSSSSVESQSEDATNNNCSILRLTLRDALLSFIMRGDDQEVLGSLSLLATLLQTKELDETMLDAIGVLPQRKQHKRLLLQALVGEDSGEEQLFSSESSSTRDDFSTELDCYLRNLKERYGGGWSFSVVGTSPRLHRCQVLDSLVNLFRRSDLSAETLWVGGWLLRQLLPHTKAEFNFQHLGFLKESYKNCTIALLGETKGIWSDLLVEKLCDEWKKCKRAIEASSPPRDPKCIFLPSQKLHGDELHPSGSSLIAGRRMCELVKVFVLHHQLQIFSTGRTLPEQPLIKTASSIPERSRARTAGLDALGPKPGNELKIVDAVPCRIAFERGKERHFSFLAVSMGSSGWIILAEELPLKQHCGVVRITAPLAGSTPRIDEKHLRWLHLRIRPSTLSSLEAKSVVPGEGKTKAMVDGRWTLAFRDEESCKRALSMILEEIDLQSSEVRRSLKPLLDFERDVRPTLDSSSSSSSSSSSLRSVQFPLDVV